MDKLSKNPLVEIALKRPKELKKRKEEYFDQLKYELKSVKSELEENRHTSHLVCRLCDEKIPLDRFLVILKMKHN